MLNTLLRCNYNFSMHTSKDVIFFIKPRSNLPNISPINIQDWCFAKARCVWPPCLVIKILFENAQHCLIEFKHHRAFPLFSMFGEMLYAFDEYVKHFIEPFYSFHILRTHSFHIILFRAKNWKFVQSSSCEVMNNSFPNF